MRGLLCSLTFAAALLASCGRLERATAQDAAAACAKAEFESVVDEAAAALRDLNNKNRPEFQDQLRKLKEKRAWTNDQFLIEAAPYVKDDQIEIFDGTTNELLDKISSMGQEGATAKVPDCAMLSELRGHMNVLISTQTEKWSYMFKKLESELAK
ncbi:MAG: hypothetical protein WC807_05795 [Hyphomicrobium sp.]